MFAFKSLFWIASQQYLWHSFEPFSNKKIGSVKGELKFLPKKLFGLLFFAWWENTSVYQSRDFLNQEIGNHHAHVFEVSK